ncbi:MAG: hypothetical protein NUV98_03750 [Candidatus Roizmanbacteria bacterium]|nr:hypothetical protein [Candidatus Roizmanbacteria bacterium]
MGHEHVLEFEHYEPTPLIDIHPEDKWEVQDWELPDTHFEGDVQTYFQVWEDLYRVTYPENRHQDHRADSESVRILDSLSTEVFLRTGYPAERIHAIFEIKQRLQS